MAESYSVQAILSAKDENFTRMFERAAGTATTLETKISSGLGFGILVGIGQRAFDKLTGAAMGFVGELSGTSKAWQTFTKNLEMNGKTEGEIKGIKKELQDFATQTIYSASDMSQTFAQLNAVGIKSAENIVKGFGGLASAAENPKQAMKTLSQQGVQMAARPKVAWQDFKLMLEQTPAGIAAVAKEMGYTTNEMVAAVHEGKIKTEDFFEAIEKVGTSDAFTEMATKYKTVDQAMDGLSETITNTALPVFEKFQSVGIKAVEKVIDAVGSIDGEALAGKINPMVDLFVIHVKRGKETVDKTIDALKQSFEAAGIKLPDLNAEGLKGVLDDVSKRFRIANKWIRAHGKEIAAIVKALPALAGAFAALKIGQKYAPNFVNLGKALGSFAGVFGTAANKGIEAGTKMVGFFKGPFGKVGGLVSKGAGKIAAGAGGLFAKIVPPDSLLALIGSKIPGILKPFGQLGSGIAGTAANASELFIKYMKNMMALALKVLAPGVLVGAVLVGLGLLYKTFQTQIDSTLDMVQTKGPEIITRIVAGATGKIPELISLGAQLVGKLLDTFTALAPSLINGGVDLIAALAGGVAAAAPTLLPKAVLLIGTLASGIISNLPRIVAIGMNLLAGLAQGIGNSMPIIVQMATKAIAGFVQGIITHGPAILASGISILKSLVYGLIQALPYIIEAAKQAGTWFINTIKEVDWLQLGKDIINGIVEGVKGGFSFIKDAVTDAFSGQNAAAEAGAQVQQQAADSITSNSYMVTDAMSGAGAEAFDALANQITGGGASIDMTALGLDASGSMMTGFETGMDGMQPLMDGVFTGITENAESSAATLATTGETVTGKITATGKQTEAVVTTTVTKITATLKRGCVQAVSIAGSLADGFVNAIRSRQGSADAAGFTLREAAINGMSGGYGRAYSQGSYIGQGLVDGMRSKSGAAWAAARDLAAAADAAIAARAKIGSPSKITTQYGKWIGEGLIIGIKDKVHGVAKQADALMKAAFKKMTSAKKRLSGVSDLAATYTDALKKSMKANYEADLDYVDSILKGVRKSAEKYFKDDAETLASYKDTISAIWSQYKKSYTDSVSGITSAVSSALTRLAKVYQNKYNELVNQRNNLKEALQTHDLFAMDDYGNVQLTNFSQQLRTVKQFRDNINKLKKSLPNGLIEEIIGLGTTDGLAYTNELLKKSTTEIKKYGKTYSTYMSSASSISTKYYAGHFSQLEKDYAADIKTLSKSVTAQMKTLGQDIVAGMIQGMNTKLPALDKTSIDLAGSIVTQIKKALKIHSPSRVAENLTGLFGEGLIVGLEKIAPYVREAMDSLLMVPALEMSMPGGGTMTLNDAYDYTSEATYTIYVESNLDGKKVGEGTAKYVRKENEKAERREARKGGKNV